ncbi:MAG TPA: hypothetical protein VFN47_15195, partial [Pedococcus sp.]|nr:hypothetical protein [Pedococcus sp.]
YDVDLVVGADARQMHRWLVGLVPFRDLVANGDVRVMGPSRLGRAFPTWFDTSRFANGFRRAEQRRAEDRRAAQRRPVPPDARPRAGDAVPA